ncbi:DUF1146 family protein [Lacticaseibacillus paracasei]|uniref:Putative membrane protein n=2 Tax=Lacticaseibacillus paracasei subsp. paracasei TaxID=47714 RepID=A0A8E0IQ14_LACPA|nr:DUF1146 family protein [Lacticaseibacillus paracasei]EPC71192.1 putative membrane protein [Lacticaseibacillus paracasei subsp. paracasei Lpp71]ALX88774.1 hypothetical protein AWC33_05950 [Lacticaseibacillus paracasei]EEI67015.1 putative membrane protein [Lacticaseibacillus paracasei subsp. paracasei ATCC 25302 = DSM 5622 = JCM 8130]EPC19258.1 putative mebrane protein [Lacticaseibacillus paracasei subsp. paracasei Lpp122]KRM66373.1 hypothetical protein FC74_GL000363 [Lacticaseibacillus parac
MFQTIGLNGAITIVSHFVFIMLAFRALNALRFEQFIKANHVREEQVLLLFIAVALGFLVSSFFLSLLQAALNLPKLFL